MAAPIHVLHLDHDPVHAEPVEHALASGGLGATLRRVATRGELLAALEGPVDAALVRQGGDGFGACEAVELIRARLDVPVVVVCSTSSDECLVRAMRAGAADCVFEDFLSRLAMVLERELREHAERRHRAQLEDELRRAESRSGLLLDAALDAVVTVTADGAISGWNAQAERMLGWTRAEMLGRDFSVLVVPEGSRGLHEQAIEAHRTGGDSVVLHGRRERQALRKDGSRIPVELTVTAFGSGADAGFGAFIRDLTELHDVRASRDQLEEQLRQAQKLEAIGTLAGGIAHDFNNILATVRGNADLAMLDLAPEHPAYEGIEHILESCDRACELVKRILTFSQRQAPQRKVLAIQPLVMDGLALLRSALPAGIEIRATLLAPEARVLADGGQLEQVFLNLATNAFQAMDGRGGVLTVRLEARHARAHAVSGGAQRRFVELSVGDTGPGIDAEHLPRVFEPFFTTRAPGEGSGLGLSVVHGIVHGHDGVVTVDSRPGEGATFRVRLPMVEEVPQTVSHAAAGNAVGRGELVMVVDDEIAITDFEARILKRFGYRVEAFSTPYEALERLAQPSADVALVLTDLTMPGMNGLDLCREARMIRPGLKVLLSSGYTTQLTPERLRQVGAAGLISKPASAQSMLEAVRAAIDGTASAARAA